MATSSREARRRRIVERGSDRLALITGRTQTLPSSPESHDSHTASCNEDLSTPLLSHQTIGSHDGEDKSSSSLLLQHEAASESGEINASDGGIGEPPYSRKWETSIEALKAPLDVDEELQSSRVLSTIQDSPVCPSDTQPRLVPQGHHHKIFTPNQITSIIAATERTRIYCSLVVAILLVLSYVGFPILGSRIIKSTIFCRPLYLVLLTNVSIVLARLLLQNQRGFGRINQEANNVSSEGAYSLAEQASKALELGLLLQDIMGAVFMDCSVYAIVVICGLSIAHILGW